MRYLNPIATIAFILAIYSAGNQKMVYTPKTSEKPALVKKIDDLSFELPNLEKKIKKEDIRDIFKPSGRFNVYSAVYTDKLVDKLKQGKLDEDDKKLLNPNAYIMYFWNERSKHKDKGDATHLGLFYLDKDKNMRLLHSEYSSNRRDVQRFDYIENIDGEYKVVRKTLDKKGNVIGSRIMQKYNLTGIVKENMYFTQFMNFITKTRKMEETGKVPQWRKKGWSRDCGRFVRRHSVYFDSNLSSVLDEFSLDAKRDTNWMKWGEVWQQYNKYSNTDKMIFSSNDNFKGKLDNILEYIVENFERNVKRFMLCSVGEQLFEKYNWENDYEVVEKPKLENDISISVAER